MNFDSMLEELYRYTQKEQAGERLTNKEQQRYVEIVDSCYKNNVEIPFGVEL